MTEKLDPQLDQAKIKQTGTTIDPIRLRNKILTLIKNHIFLFHS